MRKYIVLILMLLIVIDAAGCATFQRKFVRKKKEAEEAPRIVTQYTTEAKVPHKELYQKHYLYAKTWMEELIDKVSLNSKKDTQCINSIIGNIQDMQKHLTVEKAAELELILAELKPVQELIASGGITDTSKDSARRTVDKQYRELKRNFYYKKVAEYILKE